MSKKQRYYQDALTDQATDLLELLIKKHLDYGTRNLERFGVRGIVMRLSDKIERLINLTELKHDPQVKESIEDTLDDIAGYAIQAKLMLRGELSLPMKQKGESGQNTQTPLN